MAPASADIAARMLTDIEELIETGALLDALGRLQDMIRDFAPELGADAIRLRKRYETWRRASREPGGKAENITEIRATALELAFAAEQQARTSAVPRPEQSLAAPPEAAAGIAAAAQLDSEPPPPSRAPPVGTVDEARKNPFKSVWGDPKSVVAEVEGVKKEFKSSAFSLEPVSFHLRIGEITGVVGRNASGKTTLLRILMGELKPDAGSVNYPRVTSKHNRWAEIERQIAYVPQLPERWHGTLRHNLNFVAAVHAAKGQNVRELIDWCVARYEMERYEHAHWDEISGGYKIRFELVRALVSQPKLLVLDEPLAYLDVIARQRFLRDLQTIATATANPIPIVVTSQHLSEIEAIADQMILLDNGKKVYIGPLSGIAEQAQHRMIEVSLAAGRDEAALALEGLGLQRLEPTMEGFIFTFPKTVDVGVVFQRLRAAFGERMSAFRDITGSARSLMTEDVQ